MISNLIQPPKPKSSDAAQADLAPTTSTTAQTAARFFVGSMGEAQRKRFKTMLQSGVECGQSIAQSYGVPLKEFIAEVQKII